MYAIRKGKSTSKLQAFQTGLIIKSETKQIKWRKNSNLYVKRGLIKIGHPGATKAGYLHHFQTKKITCEDLTKQTGLCMGQQTDEVTKSAYTPLSVLEIPTLVIRMLLCSWVQGEYLHTGYLFLLSERNCFLL